MPKNSNSSHCSLFPIPCSLASARSLMILVGVLFLGCSNVSNNPPLAQETASKIQGQMLPISATAKMGTEVIELEVAKTTEQQSLGLMYRTSLAKNRGMLFTFEPPRSVRFWMKNVSIPLDMIFLRQGKIEAIFPNVPGCKVDPCPTYGLSQEIDRVIELAGGRSAELGLKRGDRVNIKLLDKP